MSWKFGTGHAQRDCASAGKIQRTESAVGTRFGRGGDEQCCMESAAEGLEELKTQQGLLLGSTTIGAEVESFCGVADRLIAEIPEYAQVFTEIQKVGAKVLCSTERPAMLREGRLVGAGVWPTGE
eukprot:2950320-Amphidinium_carterae.1